jgi:hypothetical protein
MKTRICNPFLLAGLFVFMITGVECFSQDSISLKSQTLDLKLQLLDSKLDLLDTKIKLWEAKPKELDIKLNELDSKIKTMGFDPKLVMKKINEFDSINKVKKATPVDIEPMAIKSQEQVTVTQEKEPEIIPVYKSAIMLDPARLLEGTFCLSYERVLNPRFSFNVEGLATYSTKQGLSSYYFTNQSFAAFDITTNQYQKFEGDVMYGGGINLQFRNYLLANQPNHRSSPLGLYAAPQLMFRRIIISGNHSVMEETDPGVFNVVNKKVVQKLNIFAGGVILGYKLSLFKVLAVDLYAGGNIKLSKYKNESGFTKYKNWFNIDFSGVAPVAGIAIGILK